MTFDIGLHEVCVRVGVLYVITKFSRMDSFPYFVTQGAPLRALRARQDYRVATLGIIFDVHCFLDMQSALSLYYVSYSIYHWLKVPKLLPYFLFRFSFTFHA